MMMKMIMMLTMVMMMTFRRNKTHNYKITRARQYQCASERYERELWYTIPCHLKPNNTRREVAD